MGKRVRPRDRITQRSIGFHQRQIEFFDAYPTIKPDKDCREVVDRLIAQTDPTFLEIKEEDNETTRQEGEGDNPEVNREPKERS